MRDAVHARAPVAGGIAEVAENLARRPVRSRAGLWQKLGAALDEDVELAGDGGESGEGGGSGGRIGRIGHADRSLSCCLLLSLAALLAARARRGKQRRECTTAYAARQWALTVIVRMAVRAAAACPSCTH